MTTAFWWYAGAAEAQLLAQIVTEGALSTTLDGLSASSAGTVAVVGTTTDALGSVVLSSTGTNADGFELNVTLGALTLSSIGGSEPLFIIIEGSENTPTPIINRENDYIGISVIFDSKYGEEDLTFNRVSPIIFGGGQTIIVNRTAPDIYNSTNFTPGNWKFLYKRKQ